MPGAYNQESIEAHFRNANQRLAAIEEQLKVLSDAAGVPYEQPLAEIPPDVIEMAQAGDTLGAMKRYRELTNASADKAREVVQGL
jgi:hypothetical protein